MIVDFNIHKKIIGVYLIDNNINGIQLGTTTKPTWFRKLMIMWLLGWKWINIKDLNSIKQK